MTANTPGPVVQPSREALAGTSKAADGKLIGLLGVVAGFGVAATGLLFYVIPGALEAAVGTFFLLSGIAAILFGYGYRSAKHWAWPLGVATGALYILIGSLLALAGSLFVLAGVGIIVFGTLVISQMTRREVKARLGRGAPPDRSA
jgi:uncharacterized membrane protein YfcA